MKKLLYFILGISVFLLLGTNFRTEQGETDFVNQTDSASQIYSSNYYSINTAVSMYGEEQSNTEWCFKDDNNTDGCTLTELANNDIGCRARLTSDQTITTGTWTKLNLATEDFDLGNDFDSVTNYRFTAPVDGKYIIICSNQFVNLGDGDTIAVIYKVNGVTYQGAYEQFLIGGSSSALLSSSDIINLSANDYVEMFVKHSYGSDRTAPAYVYTNYMSIHILSR